MTLRLRFLKRPMRGMKVEMFKGDRARWTKKGEGLISLSGKYREGFLAFLVDGFVRPERASSAAVLTRHLFNRHGRDFRYKTIRQLISVQGGKLEEHHLKVFRGRDGVMGYACIQVFRGQQGGLLEMGSSIISGRTMSTRSTGCRAMNRLKFEVQP